MRFSSSQPPPASEAPPSSAGESAISAAAPAQPTEGPRGRRRSFLAPFRVRSFRYQWPADLLTSWAQEMETLILGWYILTATDSVIMLTLFASLQFLGTLLAPALGSIADSVGRRAMLCRLRAAYALLASILMIAGLTGFLNPMLVFCVAFFTGLIRPSDLVMRNSMIGDTMGPDTLGSAMGLSRMTMDSARIAGALAGAGLFAAVGLGAAYIAVVTFYSLSLLLTFGTSRLKPDRGEEPFKILREVKEGLLFTWRTPRIAALMWYAFLVNLCAFPINMGVLPFAAREVFGLDETGLGKMIAMFGGGALLGSLTIAFTGGPRRRGHFIVGCILIWYGMLIAFGFAREVWQAYTLLALIGYAQGIAMITSSIALLEAAGPVMRGRIMGVRMLAVYSLPIGLVTAGWLIEAIGYTPMIATYALFGMAITVLIAVVWRNSLLSRE
ncbi:MAG TPA: MFS transporter [Alphaproteobacteria bacterium]|nr:MFS transporter [Alphaproteobacteria bacterium]